jgi:hypothetical protein
MYCSLNISLYVMFLFATNASSLPIIPHAAYWYVPHATKALVSLLSFAFDPEIETFALAKLFVIEYPESWLET